MYELRNKKTGRSYIVEQSTIDQLKETGEMRKYNLLGKISTEPVVPEDIIIKGAIPKKQKQKYDR
jgi:hypothetical protein